MLKEMGILEEGSENVEVEAKRRSLVAPIFPSVGCATCRRTLLPWRGIRPFQLLVLALDVVAFDASKFFKRSSLKECFHRDSGNCSG